MDLTDDQIGAIWQRAHRAGDGSMVDFCERALDGDQVARRIVAGSTRDVAIYADVVRDVGWQVAQDTVPAMDNTDPSADEIKQEPMLQLFKHMHLPPPLRAISQPYCELARQLLKLPRNPERSVAFRKLRESKDCAVTAALWQV